VRGTGSPADPLHLTCVNAGMRGEGTMDACRRPRHIVIAPERLKRVRPHRSRKELWTRRVRALILLKLERYPVISAIVAVVLLPGGFVLVPLIAWWHRRTRPRAGAKRGR
jgi:hypothetical protein